tara:strand:- start:1336 stop:1878 length:543 start_codon:yes stop_codon:yes gene_type:complete
MNFKEIEYKYWANDLTKEQLMDKIRSVCVESGIEMPEDLYVVSCDDYYTRSNGSKKDFVRFRKNTGRYELTIKVKEKSNVVRKEINLNVSNNQDSSIVEFLSLAGYKKDFQIYKEAWIWNFEDCDVSYYTLSDGRSVIEIEALDYNSVEEGVGIINRWERALSLGESDREPRSLYEIYTE